MTNIPRQVHLRMTQEQRQALQMFLYGDWHVRTIGFGGSRYGGKTYTGAHCLVYAALMYPNSKHLALRTVLSASDLNLGEEIKKGVLEPNGFPMGAVRGGSIQFDIKKNQFKFPNGSLIQLGFCSKPNDYEQHVGTQWDSIWLEQAEHFPERVYDDLGGSLRPSTGSKFQSRFLVTANPGGVGGEWIQRRLFNPDTRDRGTIWISSTIRKCVATLERDPGYILKNLQNIGDPVRRKQWLEGDWDAKAGSYFRLMPDTVRQVPIPRWADWYGGVDWGRDKPFAYLMIAHWHDILPTGQAGKRHIHIVKEVYQRYLEIDTQAEYANDAEQALRREYPAMHDLEIRYADPSTSKPIEGESTEQTRTIASVWAKHGFITYPSYRYSRVARWELIKYLIKRDILTIDPECRNLIREFRSAVYKRESEDLDQGRCDDHALDALAYVVCAVFGMEYVEEHTHEEFKLRMVS